MRPKPIPQTTMSFLVHDHAQENLFPSLSSVPWWVHTKVISGIPAASINIWKIPSPKYLNTFSCSHKWAFIRTNSNNEWTQQGRKKKKNNYIFTDKSPEMFIFMIQDCNEWKHVRLVWFFVGACYRKHKQQWLPMIYQAAAKTQSFCFTLFEGFAASGTGGGNDCPDTESLFLGRCEYKFLALSVHHFPEDR